MKQNYLEKIKGFYKKNKRLPSYSEMLKLFGFSSKNAIYKIVQKLVDEGVLQKLDGKLAPTSRFFALPLLGIIKAGFPIMAEENKAYLTLSFVDMPNDSKNVFLHHFWM